MYTLENILNKIQLKPENGLVFCKKTDEAIYIGERYYILEKADKLGATAVLFRRKYNERLEIIDSKPVLHIYEKKNHFFNSEEHIILHAQIWSAGDIDVYFIISSTRIDIFNARKPAEIKDQKAEKLDLYKLRLVSEALERFNDQRFAARIFAKGLFWEQEDFFNPDNEQFHKNCLEKEDAPFQQLLKHLMSVRKYLHEKPKELSNSTLSNSTIDKLLIICILIKFMEEIKDDHGKHTLRNIYKKYNIKDFAEALSSGICLDILNELGNEFRPEFNGNIFDNFLPEEKEQIKNNELSRVAHFLKATLDPIDGQYFLWKQYSFSHLPVELISAIYEGFLPKEKGVVYTPPFLVNFLIDETMPLHKSEEYFSQNQFKVLDPSCGSGVFLVAAYKRMLQWWSVNNYLRNNKTTFSKPDKKTCQEILQNTIFGVDINETATFITVFSLTIALLDRLHPKEIWNNLKLHSLQNNIQKENFFSWANTNKEKNFDLVIGNPPFNPMEGVSREKAVSDEQIKLFGLISKDFPKNNFALKFFEGAMFFGKRVCMILPSNVLLYQRGKQKSTVQKYRNHIFTDFTVNKIFDFTHLHSVLFESVDTPVCTMIANSEHSQGQKIEHIVVKRVASIEKRIFFEIDYYDCHLVPHDWATDSNKQFIWKTNLLGGGRLFDLIYRLSRLPTLKDFISKNKKNNWKENRGFEGKEEKRLIKENQDRIVEIKDNGEPKITKNTEIRGTNLKDIFMYTPPFMIIEQVLGKNILSICFVSKDNIFTDKKYLFYNRDFIGISVPQNDENILKNLFNFIKAQKSNEQLNYQLFILLISSRVLVLKETSINKSEMLSVPYSPEHKEYLRLSEAEQILQADVLEYYIHLGKAISKRGEGRKLYENVSHKQLEEFGNTFCNTINPLHAEKNMLWQIDDVYETPEKTCIIYKFIFGLKKEYKIFEVQQLSVEDLDKKLNKIIFNNKENMGALFTRVARIYGSQDNYDYLILIKPAKVRYWLKSIALRDADDTVWDYYEAGY